MEEGILGPLSGQVVLNGAGYGLLRFAPAGTSWKITNISVIASSAVNEATVNIYKNYVGAAYRQSGTYAGSSGDNNQLSNPLVLQDGYPMYVEWTGGDAGAIATCTISGTMDVVKRGFRAAT